MPVACSMKLSPGSSADIGVKSVLTGMYSSIYDCLLYLSCLVSYIV